MDVAVEWFEKPHFAELVVVQKFEWTWVVARELVVVVAVQGHLSS